MSTQTSDSLAEIRVANNPFPGLRPFEFDESHLFFGRDGQSEQLISKLSRTHFLAVVGTSGSGKSSLVRAGFLPALWGGFMTSAGSAWRIAIMRPGNDPIGNLARALNAPDVFGSELEENSAIQTAIAESTLRRGSLGLVDTLRQAVMVENENLLIVVDQFEEIFRFARVAEGEQYGNDAAAFIKLLLEAARQREVPIYVVLTMRSDYLGDCSQFWGLPEAINESQYLIPRLTRDQLREAITGPVAVGGGKITPRLVNRLLNDVGDSQDQLPVLQHLLMRAWNEWKDPRLEVEPGAGESSNRPHQSMHQGDAIDLCCAEAVGGMAHALSRHADEAYHELPDDHHREVAEKLFKALTEKGTDNREIRRPITLAEICAVTDAGKPEVITIIETFRLPGRSFLMPPVPVSLNSESLVDISHESLIRGWVRLKDWVEEEARSSRIYRRLAETAELHREGKAGLWGDPDLQLALDWHEKNKPNKNWAQRYYPHFDIAMAFLQASEKKRDDDTADRERQHQAEIERAKRDLEQAQALAEAQEQRAEAQRQKAEEQQQRLDQQARATSRLRRLIGALVIVVLLAFASAAFAFSAYRRAESASQEALTQKTIAVQEKEKAVAAANEADRQKLLALAASTEAEKQKGIAVTEKENAVIAARKAVEQTLIAEEQKKQANEASQRLIAASGRLKAEALKGEALGALKDGNPDTALKEFTKLRQVYQGMKDPTGESYALVNMADIHKERVPLSLIDEESAAYSNPLEDAEEGDSRNYAAVIKQYTEMMMMSMIMERKDEKKFMEDVSNNTNQAVAYYQRAFALNEHNTDANRAFREAGILNSLGDLQIGLLKFPTLLEELETEEITKERFDKEEEKATARGIQYYLEAVAAYGKANRPLEEAVVLTRIGDLLRKDLKKTATASSPGAQTQVAGTEQTPLPDTAAKLKNTVGFYEEAGDAFRRAGRPLKQASTLVRIGDLYKELPDEYPERDRSAIICYERARQIYRTQKNFLKEGAISEKLAQLHKTLSDNKEEIALYKTAAEAYRQAAVVDRKEADTIFRKAAEMLEIVADKSGDKADANKFFEEAISNSGNNFASKARTISAIASYYKKKDDEAEALKYYSRERESWHQAGNFMEEGDTLVEIGFIHNESKNVAAAIEAFDDARKAYKQIDTRAKDYTAATNRYALPGKLTRMASVYALHDKQKAIAAYDEALEIDLLNNYASSLTEILEGEAGLLLELKTPEGNTKAERLFQRALEFNRKVTDGEASILASIGDVYKKVGDKVVARTYYERARIAYAGGKKDYNYAAYRFIEVIKKIGALEAEANPGKTAADYYLSLAESAGLAHDSISQGTALEIYADSFRGAKEDKQKLIDNYERARLAYQGGGLRYQEAAVIRTLSNLYLGLGNKEKARELTKQADELNKAPR